MTEKQSDCQNKVTRDLQDPVTCVWLLQGCIKGPINWVNWGYFDTRSKMVGLFKMVENPLTDEHFRYKKVTRSKSKPVNFIGASPRFSPVMTHYKWITRLLISVQTYKHSNLNSFCLGSREWENSRILKTWVETRRSWTWEYQPGREHLTCDILQIRHMCVT